MIQVVAANIEKRQLDFEWINDKGAKKYQPSNRKKTTSNKKSTSKTRFTSARKRNR
jgi:hypothetical protein